MAHHHLPDPEELMECPFDKVHMIRAKRWPYHVMKCGKNYTGKDVRMCPFNARHVIPVAEFRHHVANCEDRVVIQQDIVYDQSKDGDTGTYFKGNTSVPSYHNWKPPECSEDWDSEIPSVVRIGVDPKHQAETKEPIIKDLTGMTRAQKKKYRQKLLKRSKRNETSDGVSIDSSSSDEEPAKKPEPKPQQSSGLRLPKKAPQVLQMSQMPQSMPRPVQQSSVFAYSLGMAGVGRGMAKTQQGTMPGSYPTQAAPQGQTMQDSNAALLANLSRGRGIGRGMAIRQPGGLQNDLSMPGSLSSAGIGRGRGGNTAASPQAPVFEMNPVLGQSAQGPPSFVVPTMQQNAEMDEETKKKEARKIQKKLRQIDDLLDQQKEGKELGQDQLEKISKLDELKAQLESLNI